MNETALLLSELSVLEVYWTNLLLIYKQLKGQKEYEIMKEKWYNLILCFSIFIHFFVFFNNRLDPITFRRNKIFSKFNHFSKLWKVQAIEDFCENYENSILIQSNNHEEHFDQEISLSLSQKFDYYKGILKIQIFGV